MATHSLDGTLLTSLDTDLRGATGPQTEMSFIPFDVGERAMFLTLASPLYNFVNQHDAEGLTVFAATLAKFEFNGVPRSQIQSFSSVACLSSSTNMTWRIVGSTLVYLFEWIHLLQLGL